MADENDRPRAELRAYEFPWYRRLGHSLTDYLYGDNATAAQNEWVQKFTGPENPFNLPAQAAHGVDMAREGYRTGDPGKAVLGAAETGLAVFPFAAGVTRGVAGQIERAGAERAARTAAERARSPWVNPEGVQEAFRAERPVPVFNDLNVPPPERAPRMRSAEELKAEYENVLRQGMDFVKPGSGRTETEIFYDPIQGRWKGYASEAKLPGRWSHQDNPYASYDAAKKNLYNYQHMPHEIRAKLKSPEDGLAEDILRHAYNNENIPGFAEQGEKMAARVRDLPGSQKAERDYNLRGQKNFRDYMWGDESGNYRYYQDANKYGIPEDVSEAMAEKHYSGGFESILKHYGADFQNPASIEQAYKKFWEDELALQRAGQPNLHSRAYDKMKAEEEAHIREVTGLDPRDPKNKEKIDVLMDKEQERQLKALSDLKRELNGEGPTATQRFMTQHVDPLLEKYAVPAATVAIPGGLHAAYNLGKEYGPGLVEGVKTAADNIYNWREPTVWPYEPQHISTEDMLKHFYGDKDGKP